MMIIMQIMSQSNTTNDNDHIIIVILPVSVKKHTYSC